MNSKKARAMISIGASSADMDAGLRAAKRKLKGFGADSKKLMGKGIGGAGKMLGSVLGGVGGGIGMSLAGGVGGMFGDAVGDAIGFEKSLTRLQIASGKAGSEMASFRDRVNDISKSTGLARAQILAGAQTYVDLTGDVKGAEAAMNSFARISQASGASVSDVATATASLQQSMKLDPGDIEKVFSGLISQGKMGAVSLKDFAGELSALAPKFAKFGGGTGNDAILNLGAAFQVARQGFGSASQAATGLEALMGSLAQNAGKFQKAGVKIYTTGKNGKKEFRSFNSIVDQIGKSKLANDPTLLSKAFGSKEAVDAYTQLNKNKTLLDGLATAGRDAGAVQRDLATYQESVGGKIEKAMNAAKQSIAEAFTPERIEAFANALGKAAEIFAKIVGYVDILANKGVSGLVDQRDEEIGNERAKVFVDEARGMSPEKKRAKAAQLMQEYSDLTLAGHRGGSRGREQDQRAESFRAAGATLRTQADLDQGFDIKRFEKTLMNAIAKANVVVKIDSATANKTLDNSPSHRGKGKGR